MKVIFVQFLIILTLKDVVAQSLLNLMEETNCDIERERTFIMIKPDGIQRGLIGEIIQRFERKGFKLVAMKLLQADKTLLMDHYKELSDKPFFENLVKYVGSGPVCPMVWEGLNVVKTGRSMLGETDPSKALPGTIRGDYSIAIGRNVIHGSDSVESAEREINLWFQADELVKWQSSNDKWIHGEN
ncbi:hypothetical protein HA402_003081 [Bradysia odoriphaga]|nr:hypothetical protein HA402_003081 [Bradysia odoriphaga]